MFAARNPEDKVTQENEDDGYLLTLVYNEATKESFFRIYDARTLEQVASVETEARIPYGFHANWIPQQNKKL